MDKMNSTTKIEMTASQVEALRTDFVREPTLNNYQRISQLTAIYPGRGTPLGLSYAALKLNGEAGEFAEHFGKALRDDDMVKNVAVKTVRLDDVPHTTHAIEFRGLTPERKALLIKEAGDVLWYLAAICDELRMSMSSLAQANLDKVLSRSVNNTLQGSGDNR